MSNSQQAEDSTLDLTGRLVLGRYRIVRPIARGGMGIVYLGRVEGAEGFSKPVVIKTVIPMAGSGGEGERLFAREAHIVANLQHPSIVAVIDFGKVGAAHVMVLEYVHGYHLGQWFRFVSETRGLIPVPFAVHVVLCMLDALGYAHALTRPDGSLLGIVHRDISPANVLMDLQGHIKLTDFGIARTADDEFKTQEGLFRGTLAYCAPEAVEGAAPSPLMDQYGAAVVLYHLLAGKNPFTGNDPRETLGRVLTFTPPLLQTVRSEVPAAIGLAVARALDRDPQARYPSVDDFAAAIRAGCTWSEHDAAMRFAAQIGQDFNDPAISLYLGLEPLTARDAAWREVQSTGARIALSSTPPKMMSEVRPKSQDPGTWTKTTLESPVAKAKPVRRKFPWLWFTIAMIGAGAGSAAVVMLASNTGHERASRVVVIEKEQSANNPLAPVPEESPAAPSVEAPKPPEPLAQPSASAASSSRPIAAAAATPAARGALLARQFQKQEGKIQSCFQQYPTSLEATPKISVRFQIDVNGATQAATVSPATVAATPLGACIVSVARATQFGAQQEPISFVIPIAARITKH